MESLPDNPPGCFSFDDVCADFERCACDTCLPESNEYLKCQVTVLRPDCSIDCLSQPSPGPGKARGLSAGATAGISATLVMVVVALAGLLVYCKKIRGEQLAASKSQGSGATSTRGLQSPTPGAARRSHSATPPTSVNQPSTVVASVLAEPLEYMGYNLEQGQQVSQDSSSVDALDYKQQGEADPHEVTVRGT